MQQQSPNKEPTKFSELRRQAESILLNRAGIEHDAELMDVRRLLTELHVHQIELEIQNEELRHAQIQLSIEREKYADMYNFAPVAYFTFDENGIILDLNMAAADLLEHTRKYLTNHPISPYLVPDSLKVFIMHRQKVLATRQAQTCELVFRRGNGDQVFVQAHSMALESGSSGTRLWRSVMTDITERKIVVDKLRESEERFRQFFEQSSEGIAIVNESGVVVAWNKALENITGYMKERAVGKTFVEIQTNLALGNQRDPELLDRQAEFIQNALQTGDPRVFNKVVSAPYQRFDGESRFIQQVMFLIKTSKGQQIGVLSRDITDQKKAEAIQQARVRVIEYASHHALVALLQYAMDELCQLTDSPIGFFHFVEDDQRTLSLQAWSTRTIEEFCTTEGKGQHYDIDEAGIWVECVKLGRPVIHNDYASHPSRKGLPEGHSPVIREMVFPIFRNEKIVAIIGVGNKPKVYEEADLAYAMQLADMIWEIVERKRSEQSLRESEERFRTLVNSMDDVVFTLDTQQRHTGVYGDWVQKSGFTPEFFLGKTVQEVLGPEASEIHEKANSKALEGQTATYEWSTGNQNGTIYYQTVVSPLLNADGNVVGIVGVGRDMTVSKKAEEAVWKANDELQAQLEEIQSLQAKLREQAIRDPLTGLYNRRYLQETLEREVARARRMRQPIGIIVMDIDHFKEINDQFGHDAGDTVLREIGNLITESVRAEDIPCRTGGEEFVIIMPGASLQAAQERALLLREKFHTLQVEYNQQKMQTTASMGVAIFPYHGDTGDETLIHADRALYQSKQNGRDRVSVFQDSIRTPRLWKK